MNLSRSIDAALGHRAPQLVFKNARVVNVFTGGVKTADVAVEGGYVVGLGEYQGEREVHCSGRYLMPSFLDSHVHVESSMLTPLQYARAVAPHGVTAVIADPHEIANVCGEAGLEFMLESARDLPFDFHFMLPSCVPATPFDVSGARFDGAATRALFLSGRFLGLGELMDYPALLAKDREVLQKAAVTELVDGHAPLLSGKQLNAYVCAGPRTEHECASVKELKEKAALGMYIQLREGSQSKLVKKLATGVDGHNLRRMLFCTDDKYLSDIVAEGTVAQCVRQAIAAGMEPVDAIIAATLNGAECYGLKRRGAVAPGYRADLVLAEDLNLSNILEVYKDGRLIAKDGEALFDGAEADTARVRGTVKRGRVRAEDFCLPFDPSRPVIQLLPHSLDTKKCYVATAEGLNLCAVAERHGKTGQIGRGHVLGFGIVGGAIAQTIGHDSHNITVAGDNGEDMALAVNSLGDNGGVAVVEKGCLTAFLELPVGGIMTPLPVEQALPKYREVIAAGRRLSHAQGIDPFMTLEFLSLLVLPHLRVNVGGLFDVEKYEYV